MSGRALEIATVVGARPQFVKAAAITRAIARASASGVRVVDRLIHTGQHYDHEMSQIFFEGLELPAPDHHLGVGSGSHASQTGQMLVGIEHVLVEHRPDVVVVHGDTNSTLAGALAAVKLGVPVAHVEAGLRSYDLSMPEEVNRVCADRVSQALFVPTQTGVDNLAREGITDGVELAGDVMLDVLRAQRPTITTDVLGSFDVEPEAYALATIHRAGNTDDARRLGRIMDGLARVSKELPVVLPLHPRTRAVLDGAQPLGDVRVVDPVGYASMLALETHARVICTDSGGVQKEAYWLGVPCVTLRAETEWPETLHGSWNVLTDDDPEAIEREALRGRPSADRPDAFGDGDAADRVVSSLVARFGTTS